MKIVGGAGWRDRGRDGGKEELWVLLEEEFYGEERCLLVLDVLARGLPVFMAKMAS